MEVHPRHVPEFWKGPRFPHLLPFSLSSPLSLFPVWGVSAMPFPKSSQAWAGRQHQVPRLGVRASRTDARKAPHPPARSPAMAGRGRAVARSRAGRCSACPVLYHGQRPQRHRPSEPMADPSGRVATCLCSVSFLGGSISLVGVSFGPAMWTLPGDHEPQPGPPGGATDAQGARRP